jgi:nitroreductase
VATSALTAAPGLHDLLARRWSPRGFSPERQLDETALVTLLEAARWAPSANNSQPWRFGVARRGERAFEALTAALASGNQVWARHAGALVLIAAQTVDHAGRRRRWAVYDAGQAAAHLTVQAQAQGLSVHQMGGFDPAAAAEVFGLLDDLEPLVVLAVGWHDPDADLPEPFASREQAPRVRLPLTDLLLTPADGTAANETSADETSADEAPADHPLPLSA